jgi:hypothetical protein
VVFSIESAILLLVADRPSGGIRFVGSRDTDSLSRRAREHADDRFAAFHDLASQSCESADAVDDRVAVWWDRLEKHSAYLYRGFPPIANSCGRDVMHMTFQVVWRKAGPRVAG